MGMRQKASRDARTTTDDLGSQRRQRLRLTLVRTPTYAQSHVTLRVRRVFGIAAALCVALLVSACSGPTPQTAFNPQSDYANEGLNLFVLIIIMGVVIGVIVEGVLIWAAIRYRR